MEDSETSSSLQRRSSFFEGRLRVPRPRLCRVVRLKQRLPVHGFEGPVIFDSVGAGGNANRVPPCLVCWEDVALLEIRVAAKALRQAESAAEELDTPGQNHRAKDAEVKRHPAACPANTLSSPSLSAVTGVGRTPSPQRRASTG